MIRRTMRLVGLGIAACAACRTPLQTPRLGDLYNEPAQYHDQHRNPVIVIPGILGSRLVDQPTGQVVWGAFSGDYADPRKDDGLRLIALPMREGARLDELRDAVVPAGVLDQVRLNLLFLPLELKAYTQILAVLGVGGYRDELLSRSGAVDYGDDHLTCFQFSYDWRRDIVESARQLDEFIQERRRYVQRELLRRYGIPEANVKVDIVAHSMGGLVARYYLQYGTADLPSDGSTPPITWAGAKYVDKAILIGTPNAGSIKALVQLVDGASFAPILPEYPPAMLGTMPAVYQLLPRARHSVLRLTGEDPNTSVDLLDPALWERMGWGLASPKQDAVIKKMLPDVQDATARRRVALEHLRKCLKRTAQLHAALDVPAAPPEGLEIHLFAGDAQKTAAVAEADPRNGRLRIVEKAPGDGTVIRSSALMDERVGRPWEPGLRSPIDWNGVTFLFTGHLGLTKDPAFFDNVLFLLLESHPPHASPAAVTK